MTPIKVKLDNDTIKQGREIPEEVADVIYRFVHNGDEVELMYSRLRKKWVMVVPGIGHISIDESILLYSRQDRGNNES